MRISDWSSDVCSSDLGALRDVVTRRMGIAGESTLAMMLVSTIVVALSGLLTLPFGWVALGWAELGLFSLTALLVFVAQSLMIESLRRSEEHTSELQSLMRISYAVLCLKKKKQLE